MLNPDPFDCTTTMKLTKPFWFQDFIFISSTHYSYFISCSLVLYVNSCFFYCFICILLVYTVHIILFKEGVVYSYLVYCLCILYNFQLRIYYSLLFTIVRVILIMTNVAPCECVEYMLVEPITRPDWCLYCVGAQTY